MRSIYLVARRDYLGYVTAWGFWLGLMLTPILMAVFMLAPAMVASSQPVRYYAVIDTDGAFTAAMDEQVARARVGAARDLLTASELLGNDADTARAAFDAAIEAGDAPEDALLAAGLPGTVTLPDLDFQRVAAPAREPAALTPYLLGETLVSTPAGPRPLFAVLIVTEDGVEYWSENITVGGLKSIARRAAEALARSDVFSAAGVPAGILEEVRAATPDLVEKRPRANGGEAAEVTLADRAPFVVAVGIAFLLWTLIFSVVNYLLMGTIEERSNKIFDTLLTSTRLPHLLAGKLIAVLAVSLTLMSVWSLGGTLVTILAAAAMPPEIAANIGTFVAAMLQPGIILPAILSFLLGYLMYGSVFLALGSLCDTIQEAQTLMTPLLVLLMVPLVLVIVALDDPNSPILQAMSWVPLFTPFLLILRMPTAPPLWEVFALLALMAATTLVVLWLAAKVYRAGAVHGAGVNDALAWLRGLLPGGKKKEGAA